MRSGGLARPLRLARARRRRWLALGRRSDRRRRGRCRGLQGLDADGARGPIQGAGERLGRRKREGRTVVAHGPIHRTDRLRPPSDHTRAKVASSPAATMPTSGAARVSTTLTRASGATRATSASASRVMSRRGTVAPTKASMTIASQLPARWPATSDAQDVPHPPQIVEGQMRRIGEVDVGRVHVALPQQPGRRPMRVTLDDQIAVASDDRRARARPGHGSDRRAVRA